MFPSTLMRMGQHRENDKILIKRVKFRKTPPKRWSETRFDLTVSFYPQDLCFLWSLEKLGLGICRILLKLWSDHGVLTYSHISEVDSHPLCVFIYL